MFKHILIQSMRPIDTCSRCMDANYMWTALPILVPHLEKLKPADMAQLLSGKHWLLLGNRATGHGLSCMLDSAGSPVLNQQGESIAYLLYFFA